MPDIGGGLTAFLGEAAPDPGGGAALPTVQDEFGLQWVGAFQDEPSLDLLKRCVQGTKLACYCPAGLIVGKLTKSNSRSSTGVTFELGDVILMQNPRRMDDIPFFTPKPILGNIIEGRGYLRVMKGTCFIWYI